MGVALKLQCYRITKLFTEWAGHNVVGVVLIKMASEEKGEKWRALLLKVAGVLSLIVILATFIKPPKTLGKEW